MKRIICLFISIATLFSFSVIANAKEEGKYTVGEIIEVGSYPQTQVTDKTLTATLDGLTPEAEGYFDEQYYSDGHWIKEYHMMRYKDVVYNKESYRGIYISFYRPFTSTAAMGDEYYTSQDDNGYKEGEWYWFKYEPLKWKIFDSENGYALCENVIDAQAFNNRSEYDQYSKVYTTTSQQYGYAVKYANTYHTSSLRYWLEHEFTETAFSEDELGSLTQFMFEPGGCDFDLNSAYNPPSAAKTHIGLLTYDQAFKETIVVSDGYYSADADVSKDFFRDSRGSGMVTDYAKALGVDGIYTFWWLATGDGTGTETIYTINASEESGKYIVNAQCGICSSGVRPVICVADLAKTEESVTDGEEAVAPEAETEKKADSASVEKTDEKTDDKKNVNPVVVAVPVAAVGAGAASAVIIRKKKLK